MFKDKEIMNKLNISRQAVYNNKNEALKNLSKMLEQQFFVQFKSL